MRVLFATGNEAKVRRFKDKLEKEGIELISLKDIDVDVNVEETGKTAIENARIKAKAYFDATGITTMAMDDTLYFENVKESDQPGTHVRRVNGKELTDDEMLVHYKGIATKYGGKLIAKWVYGMVIASGDGLKEFNWSKDEFYIVDKEVEKRNPGYPLDSISIDKTLNKYFAELTKEDRDYLKTIAKDTDKDVVEFLINNLK